MKDDTMNLIRHKEAKSMLQLFCYMSKFRTIESVCEVQRQQNLLLATTDNVSFGKGKVENSSRSSDIFTTSEQERNISGG